MDCRKIIEKVFLYIDGEIAGVDCAQIEAHLETCQDCLHHYGFEIKIKDVVRKKCAQPAPAEMMERLRRFVAGLPDV